MPDCPTRERGGFLFLVRRDSSGLVELSDCSCGSQFIKRFTEGSFNDKRSNGPSTNDASEARRKPERISLFYIPVMSDLKIVRIMA